jgi:hypothetical protein
VQVDLAAKPSQLDFLLPEQIEQFGFLVHRFLTEW